MTKYNHRKDQNSFGNRPPAERREGKHVSLRNEAERLAGAEFQGALSAFVPRGSRTREMKPSELREKKQKILEGIEDLYALKSPYLGAPIKRESSVTLPNDLKPISELLSIAGHDIFCVIDNLLLARAMGSPSPAGNAFKLFPPKTTQVWKDYRTALDKLDETLKKGDALTSEGIFEIKAESIPFAVAALRSSMKKWHSKASYPHMVDGPMLLIEPELSIGTSLPFVVGNKKMVLVSSNYWAAEVYSEIGKLPGKKDQRVQLESLGYGLTRVLKDLLVRQFDMIHANGSELRGPSFQLLQELAKKLKEKGKIIIDFNPNPEERRYTSGQGFIKFVRQMLDLGFSFDFKLGRASSTLEDGVRVFHPASLSEKDTFTFTKRRTRDHKADLEKLVESNILLADLADLDNAEEFNARVDNLNALSISFGSVLMNLAKGLFGIDVNVNEHVDINAVRNAAKYLQDKNYEEFVRWERKISKQP